VPFRAFLALELLLSGRLVPVTLMPTWVQQLAWYLPFQWMYYFPIESPGGTAGSSSIVAWLGYAGLLDHHWRNSRQTGLAVGYPAVHCGGELNAPLQARLDVFANSHC